MKYLNAFLFKYSGLIFALVYAVGALRLVFTNTGALFYYALIPAVTLCTNLIIRKIVKRKRPENKINMGRADESFPSNHSASAAIIGFACLTVHPIFGAAVLFLAVLTGISRVAAGVHYPGDVAGGFLLAALFAAVWFL